MLHDAYNKWSWCQNDNTKNEIQRREIKTGIDRQKQFCQLPICASGVSCPAKQTQFFVGLAISSSSVAWQWKHTYSYDNKKAHIARRQGSGKLPFAVCTRSLSHSANPSGFSSLPSQRRVHCIFTPVACFKIENDLSYCGIENKQHPKANIAQAVHSIVADIEKPLLASPNTHTHSLAYEQEIN